MIQTNPHGRKVDTSRDEPTPRHPFAPGVIEGPDHDDFLKQESALHAAVRWGLEPLLAIAALICLAFSLGFFGRHLGLL